VDRIARLQTSFSANRGTDPDQVLSAHDANGVPILVPVDAYLDLRSPSRTQLFNQFVGDDDPRVIPGRRHSRIEDNLSCHRALL